MDYMDLLDQKVLEVKLDLLEIKVIQETKDLRVNKVCKVPQEQSDYQD